MYPDDALMQNAQDKLTPSSRVYVLEIIERKF
jgi:hypothetical protein